MEKVRVQVAKTPEGYCATVDILPGFIVAVTGDFSELKKELFESVDFYVECAKADGDVYPEVLNQEYEFEYKFDVESLLFFYEKILSKAADTFGRHKCVLHMFYFYVFEYVHLLIFQTFYYTLHRENFHLFFHKMHTLADILNL